MKEIRLQKDNFKENELSKVRKESWQNIAQEFLQELESQE